jgi:hypothetical protein
LRQNELCRYEVGGYPRGLWIDSEIVAVGISASRPRSKSEGTRNTDLPYHWSGIVFLNRKTGKEEERLALTHLGMEPFAITAIPEFQPPVGFDAAITWKAEWVMHKFRTLKRLVQKQFVGLHSHVSPCCSFLSSMASPEFQISI